MSSQFLAGFGLQSAGVNVGMPAPDFTLSRPDGTSITLTDLKGQPAILAFYPSQWDPARNEQLLQFNALVSRVPGVDAELLGISSDGLWCQLAFADSELCVPVVGDLDPMGAVAERYGVSGEQAVFVVDAEGIIRWRHIGPAGVTPQIDELISALADFAPGNAARFDGNSQSDFQRDTQSTAHSESSLASSKSSWPLAAHSVDSAFNATRRDFVTTALAAAFTLTALPRLARAQQFTDTFTVPERLNAAATPVVLKVNGQELRLTIEPRVTLLDALREYAGLTGTKKGCDHGQCGACTVHVNGRRTLSCLSFATMHQRDEITTVEGLAKGDALHPMQAAFIEHDGFQCGYCTPGQLMSATALLTEPCGKSDADVAECMSGNICRCGAYPGIVAAVQKVRGN